MQQPGLKVIHIIQGCRDGHHKGIGDESHAIPAHETAPLLNRLEIGRFNPHAAGQAAR
jgi:hypothetical protein